MSRYIDADELINKYRRCAGYENNKFVSTTWSNAFETIVDDLEEMPTADVRENVKGEWIDKYEPPFDVLAKGQSKYVCSNCGWRTHNVPTEGKLVGGYGAEATRAEWVYTKYEDVFYNFCPNCGADMRGGSND